MSPSIVKTISRIYLILALLSATLLSPLPYSVVALFLLLLQIYLVYKPPRAALSLGCLVLTLLLLPLIFETLMGMLSALLIIPAIPLLGFDLRGNALSQSLPPTTRKRSTTITLRSLAIALVIVIIISVLVADWSLTLAGVLLLVYLGGILGYILFSIGGSPLEESKTRVRVIAGDTCQTEVSLRNRARIPFRVFLHSPYEWFRLSPSQIELNGKEAKINLSITPPLAGPAKLQLEASLLDPWGLFQTRQTLELVELYVIPRARYAEWLARKYLEGITAIPAQRAKKQARQGMEYYDSRPYQPGDRLKDIDWKRTLKLQELIVKEFAEIQKPTMIIAVNLAVRDAEQADQLAYSLIVSTLTMVREGVPTALAAYNHQDVLETTPAQDPREALKKAMKLGHNIVLVEPMERVLQLVEVRGIRRTMRQLEEARTEPAKRLRGILQLEWAAMQEAAKEHPAKRALITTTACTPPPAIIGVISAWNHDAEALSITLEELRKRGYRALILKIDSSTALWRQLKD